MKNLRKCRILVAALLKSCKGSVALILFTSDLDRTLLYSVSMMKKYPIDDIVTAVEYKGEKAISFMSQYSIEKLSQFHENHLFVPVTTRAIYQYERIAAFQQWLQPKYAIMSNGGTIQVDGQLDIEWVRKIQEKITTTSVSKEDFLQLFAEIRHNDWVLKEHVVDEFFYMFHINEQNVPFGELIDFERKLATIGWKLFLQGRKLYFLPIQLNKASAVTYLKSCVDYDIHVAAGDSLMDYDMLRQAGISYSPAHGELFRQYGDDSMVTWLKGKGANSADELLRQLLQMTIQK